MGEQSESRTDLPHRIDMVHDLRQALGLPVVAMSAPPAEVWERALADVRRLRVMIDGWDHFHDECFTDDPYLRGRVHAEVERLSEEATDG